MKGFFARLSGYYRLVGRYPVGIEPEGPLYTRQTVQIGPVRYRRCVTVYVGPQGLYLQPRVLLIRYLPILIPWDEVVRVENAMIYWRRARRLSVGEPEVGTIAMQMGLFRLIQPYLSSKLSEQP
jgi:hypothetical protein